MMKLKVVDNYRRVEVVEADTIGSLKARIMECFSLTEEDLCERLLVRDGRAIPLEGSGSPMPMVNGFDLLELEEGSILKDHFCFSDYCIDYGDALLLGWKGPFIVSLLPARCFSSFRDHSLNIVVGPYTTLCELKKEIVNVTKEDVTEDNLPTILVEGDNNKPLIFFGFYNYYKGPEMLRFYINRNRDNKLVLWNEKYEPNFCFYRAVPEMPRYFRERKYDIDEDFMDLKVDMLSDEKLKDLKVDNIDQYGGRILVPLTDRYNQKKMDKGMEGDKEVAGPSYKLYQLSVKEREELWSIPDNMDERLKEKMKQQLHKKKNINC